MKLRMAVVFAVALSALPMTSAHAESCIRCITDMACGPGSNCCCNVICVSYGCVCSYYGVCQSGCSANCDNSDPSSGTKFASLDPPAAALERAFAGDQGDPFNYTMATFTKLEKASRLIALTSRSLAQNCKTKQLGSVWPVQAKAIQGFANVGSGSAQYEGSLTVTSKRMIIDLVIQPDQKNKRARRIHAEIDPVGSISNYSEKPL